MNPDESIQLRYRFLELVQQTLGNLPDNLLSADREQHNFIQPQKDQVELGLRMILGRVEVILVHHQLNSPEKFQAFFSVGPLSPKNVRRISKDLLEANFHSGAFGLSGYCMDARGIIHFSESFALASISSADLIRSIEERHAFALILQDQLQIELEPSRS